MKTPSRRPASLYGVVLLSILWGACALETGERLDEPAHAEGASEDGVHGEAVSLDLAGVRGVSFELVGEPREEGAWFAAEAISSPAAEAAVSAPVAGRVVAIRAAPGAVVAEGAPVVEMVSSELADLKAVWLAAQARLEQARRAHEREQRLFEGGATARRELEAAEADAAVAAADEEAARLALLGRGVEPEAASERYVARAPRPGVVAALDVRVGEAVETGRRLATLVAPGAGLARVELPLPGPERWLPGAESEVRRADGRRWRALVEGTPPELSPVTRRLAYRLRLVGGELPLAGTPLEARVPLARAIVLPQVALQQVEGSWGVFVREGDHAEFRPVRKGPELGAEVMVLDGVVPGENVATEGAYLLKALWLKRAGGGATHDH